MIKKDVSSQYHINPEVFIVNEVKDSSIWTWFRTNLGSRCELDLFVALVGGVVVVVVGVGGVLLALVWALLLLLLLRAL